MSRLAVVQAVLRVSRRWQARVPARTLASAANILDSPFGTVETSNLSLTDYIWNESRNWQDKPVVTCGLSDHSYTFGECKELSQRIAWTLIKDLHLKKGDVIGVVMPNIPEYVPALHGAIAAGLVVTFANPLYTADEIKRQFKNAGVKCCITTPEQSHTITEVAATLPDYQYTIIVGQNEHKVANKTLSFDQLLKEAKPVELPKMFPDDIAVLPFSSGTTGIPKGVKLTHKNLVSNLTMLQHDEIMDHIPTSDTYQEVSLSVLPFFHIYGFNGILNCNMVYGFNLVTMQKFTPENYLTCMIKYKPTILFVVPSLLLFLASHPSVTREHLSSLRSVTSGAAPATKSLIDKFRAKVGRDDVKIRQGYGMTETAPVTLFTPRTMPESKMSSCGRVIPHTEARVVHLETGESLGPHKSGELLVRGPQVSHCTLGQLMPSTQGKVVNTITGDALGPFEPGELCIQGPQVMNGYLNNEKATRETIDADGWLHTGDVMYYDNDEYFFIVDRTKELIKVKGNQVSPTELENIIMELVGVADVAVVGIPDALADEVPRAFVVRRAGSQVTEQDVLDHVAPRVVKYKRLAGGVKFIDAIPRNPSGKVLRQQLKVVGENKST